MSAHPPLSGPHLIAYADRFGGDLQGLRRLIATKFPGAFRGAHVLPFYTPFDGADAGFDPSDHTVVDPRLGEWDDVRALTSDLVLTADVIVNHISSQSRQFQDVQALGDGSEYAGMFLTMGSVFPDGATEADLTSIYRPRPGLPFTAMRLGGRRRLVWTTFTQAQVDLDIDHPLTWAYLRSVIDRMTSAGVTILRLDAIGYAGKVPGTNCFLTARGLDFIERLRAYAHEHGALTLLEVHAHHTQQIEVAAAADLVYDFSTPPLLLHALFTADTTPLAGWLSMRPANCVTVLDTHDGIGLMDAARNDLRPSEPGLLDDDQVAELYETVLTNGGRTSREATGSGASNLDLYQVNCTFYDAVGRVDERYLLARAVQLFLPGLPQVYYVGLLAGSNDADLLARSGVGRDVNRHHYSMAEIDRELERPIVQAQMRLLRLRAGHPAFNGTFGYKANGAALSLTWRAGSTSVSLEADFAGSAFRILSTSADGDSVLTQASLLSGASPWRPEDCRAE